MVLKDQRQTRIKNSAVTSFYPDREVLTMQKVTYPSIRLTIGSCAIHIIYDKAEDRDADLAELDQKISLE
jgi:hypothetical protein